jgi:NAD(P)-dependent dehydrogenase (short-subunit alcohol dehydrogenase family)
MLTGQTVLITGAARGIGAAAARECAARGASVALVGLEGEELERTAASCGAQAAAFEADVTDTEQLEAAVAAAVERFGGLDAVVANAGIGGGGTVRLADPAAFEKVIEVNLLGTYRTIKATLPHVIARRGYVLPVASMAAAVWNPGMGAYNASKAGVEALGRTLGVELQPHGVAVGVAYFSWIDTDLVRSADAHPLSAGLRQKAPKPFSTTYPVEATGRAIADGIENRSPTVIVPTWAKALLLARTLFRPLAAREGAKHVGELEERAEREIARSGAAAASRPVGPGGEAAMRAAEARAAQPESVGSRE